MLSIWSQTAINGWLAGHEVLHAVGGIEEGEEEAYHQQRVDGCTKEQQARQGGDLGHDDAVVDGKCHKSEEDKDDVVGGHT